MGSVPLQSVPMGNVLEIAKVMPITVTKAINSENGFTNVEHGLGFTPIIEAHWFDPANFVSQPLPWTICEIGRTGPGLVDNGKVSLSMFAQADETYIYVDVFSPAFSVISNFYYTNNFEYKFIVFCKRYQGQ